MSAGIREIRQHRAAVPFKFNGKPQIGESFHRHGFIITIITGSERDEIEGQPPLGLHPDRPRHLFVRLILPLIFFILLIGISVAVIFNKFGPERDHEPPAVTNESLDLTNQSAPGSKVMFAALSLHFKAAAVGGVGHEIEIKRHSTGSGLELLSDVGLRVFTIPIH